MSVGILTGVIVTIIVQVIGNFLKFFIAARIGRRLIRMVLIIRQESRNLTGIWETKFWKDERSYQEIAKVSQFLGRVTGIIEFRKGGQLRKYRMTGRIKEGILSATYEIVNPKKTLDRGSFTLLLSRDGDTLDGCYSWTDDENQVPQGDKYIWIKPLERGINGIQIRKSTIHGDGVFASEKYLAGSDIAYFHGYEVNKDTRNSLTLEGRKIEPIGPLRYLNHSCEPNCDFKGRSLVTNRQVNILEELTINYLCTENHIGHSFKCNCGAIHCKKSIVIGSIIK